MPKCDLHLIFDSFKNGVAHRGLHDEVRPENSKAAFENAMNVGLPFETDVHLTKDKELIINHDNDLERVTGRKGLIEELTLADIKAGYRLKDGSSLLTLEELIALWEEKVPMVLELKAYKDNQNDLHKKVAPLLDKIVDPSKLVLISFDEKALEAFKGEGWNRGLLVGGGEIDSLHDVERFDFLDMAFPLLNDERVIDYRKKGGLVMSWTPRNKEELAIAKAGSDAITFEFLSPSLLKRRG